MTDLLRTLTAEADAVLRFVDLLKQEQQTLAGGDVDAITPLISQKNVLATDLAVLAKQRNALLAVGNFAPDRAGIDAWCEHHPEKEQGQDRLVPGAISGQRSPRTEPRQWRVDPDPHAAQQPVPGSTTGRIPATQSLRCGRANGRAKQSAHQRRRIAKSRSRPDGRLYINRHCGLSGSQRATQRHLGTLLRHG